MSGASLPKLCWHKTQFVHQEWPVLMLRQWYRRDPKSCGVIWATQQFNSSVIQAAWPEVNIWTLAMSLPRIYQSVTHIWPCDVFSDLISSWDQRRQLWGAGWPAETGEQLEHWGGSLFGSPVMYYIFLIFIETKMSSSFIFVFLSFPSRVNVGQSVFKPGHRETEMLCKRLSFSGSSCRFSEWSRKPRHEINTNTAPCSDQAKNIWQ